MAIPRHTFEFDGWEDELFPGWDDVRQPGETSVACLARTIETYLWHPSLILREAVEYMPPCDVPAEAGLYFLIHGSEIGYVGLSKCIRDRLFQQWRIIPFERYWCFGGIPEPFLDRLEALYIHAIEPRFNSDFPLLYPQLRAVLEELKRGTRPYTFL